jgi:hypothetical protein
MSDESEGKRGVDSGSLAREQSESGLASVQPFRGYFPLWRQKLLSWVYEFTASMSLTFSGRLTVLVVAIRQRSNARPFHQTKPRTRQNFFRRDAG